MTAEDKYGNVLYVGDTVSQIGSSPKYVITDIYKMAGEVVVDIEPIGYGGYKTSNCHGQNLLKVS